MSEKHSPSVRGSYEHCLPYDLYIAAEDAELMEDSRAVIQTYQVKSKTMTPFNPADRCRKPYIMRLMPEIQKYFVPSEERSAEDLENVIEKYHWLPYFEDSCFSPINIGEEKDISIDVAKKSGIEIYAFGTQVRITMMPYGNTVRVFKYVFENNKQAMKMVYNVLCA